MQEKRNLLIGLILGGLIGWASGFLRLPFIEKNFSFLIGFLACLALVSLGLMIVFVWNKNAYLIRLLGKDLTAKGSKNAIRTYAYVWILVALFIVLGGLISSVLIFNQNRLFKSQTEHQNKKISQQSELIESIRKSNLVFLMSNVLDKVDDELNSTKGTLSNATIARIAALSYSFKPYRYIKGDSLSEKMYSPERGQLLLALSLMNIDSISFEKIKIKTPFSLADLRGVDLRGIDLGGANLKGANFNEADLRRAKLKGADLRGVNFRGADLREADMAESDLKRADLSWADLSETDLKGSDMNGANLTAAILRNADLRMAGLRWADLSGAFFNEANMKSIDMAGSDLKRVNLSAANLSDADVRYSNFNEANLSGAELSGAIVETGNWLEKLNGWSIIGEKQIQEKYKIVDYIPDQSKYRLEKIKD